MPVGGRPDAHMQQLHKISTQLAVDSTENILNYADKCVSIRRSIRNFSNSSLL